MATMVVPQPKTEVLKCSICGATETKSGREFSGPLARRLLGLHRKQQHGLKSPRYEENKFYHDQAKRKAEGLPTLKRVATPERVKSKGNGQGNGAESAIRFSKKGGKRYVNYEVVAKYRSTHGLTETAQHFGISTSAVSRAQLKFPNFKYPRQQNLKENRSKDGNHVEYSDPAKGAATISPDGSPIANITERELKLQSFAAYAFGHIETWLEAKSGAAGLPVEEVTPVVFDLLRNKARR